MASFSSPGIEAANSAAARIAEIRSMGSSLFRLCFFSTLFMEITPLVLGLELQIIITEMCEDTT
jgi:hypothetical protein